MHGANPISSNGPYFVRFTRTVFFLKVFCIKLIPSADSTVQKVLEINLFFAPSPNWYEVGDDTLTQVDTAHPPKDTVFFLLSSLKSMLTILIKHLFKQVAANRGLTMLFSERWNVSEIARVNISELTRNHKPYVWRSISGALALANIAIRKIASVPQDMAPGFYADLKTLRYAC